METTPTPPNNLSGPREHRASILLLAYNQARTIEAAMQSCLAQRGEPLHIVCSDDASTDDSWRVMQAAAAAYRGPHRVTVRRNDFNLGIAGHYNRLCELSRSDLLITAAGDDISEPDRSLWLLQAWDATGGRADLITSHVTDMDAEGGLHGVLRVDDLARFSGVAEWAVKRPHVIGAAHAFTRRLMTRFGRIDDRLRYEDQIIAFRAIASGGAVTVQQPLVRYRRGGESSRPPFSSDGAYRAWRVARLQREMAECDQLARDAEVAGCRPIVDAALAGLKERQRFQSSLFGAAGGRERWQALLDAHEVPLVWRIGKWFDASLPSLRK